jgi:hypothetical protein
MLRIPKGPAPWLTARLLVFNGLAGWRDQKGFRVQVEKGGSDAVVFLNPANFLRTPAP